MSQSDASYKLGWLEMMGHSPFIIAGTCTLGRAAANHLVLNHEKVSRRHAIIHAQGEHEYWLVDLGSSNGTLVNGRRVTGPVRLQSGDQIEIKPFRLIFRQSGTHPASAFSEQVSEHTVPDIHPTQSWLLLVDIVGSTPLSRELPADEMAKLIGQWFSHCKELLEGCAGLIDKYLGDGFLAFWDAATDRSSDLTRMIDGLKAFQNARPPAFRFVLHYGEVFTGGRLATVGAERLFGAEVNFLFRAERLASSQGWTRVLTDAAARRLKLEPPPEPAGSYVIQGFPGDHRFFVIGGRDGES